MSQRLAQITQHFSDSPKDVRGPERLLTGHVVLITGGAQGIGEATSRLFARHGAKIAISDIDVAKSQSLVDDIRTGGAEALAVPGDLLDPDYPDILIKTVLNHFGKINCLINNAGFLNDRALHKMTDEQWNSVLRIHTYVPFQLMRSLSSHFMDPNFADSPKTVINISSSSGLHGQLGQLNYATAKAGIVGMTKAVAREWARYNVRCNGVAYGWMDTRMTRVPTTTEKMMVGGKDIGVGVAASAKKFRDTNDVPLGRPGTAEEAAGCLLFLASDLSSYVTGQIIECNGGRFM